MPPVLSLGDFTWYYVEQQLQHGVLLAGGREQHKAGMLLDLVLHQRTIQPCATALRWEAVCFENHMNTYQKTNVVYP